MTAIEVPADVYPRVHAVEERVQVFRDRGEWGSVLGAWLELARAYPHDEWPVRILMGQYRSAGECTGSMWVDFGTQAHQARAGMEGLAAAEREFLSGLQYRIAARLEALARHRGIRIWRRRRVRAGFYLIPNVAWVPWGGESGNGLYVHTALPTRLPYRPAGRGPRALRWRFPGYAFVIRRESIRWYPAVVAQLLAFHLVAMRQRQRRVLEIGLLTDQALRAPSVSARLAGLKLAAQRSREMPTPLEALHAPTATDTIIRIQDAILVYLIRKELRRSQEQ